MSSAPPPKANANPGAPHKFAQMDVDSPAEEPVLTPAPKHVDPLSAPAAPVHIEPRPEVPKQISPPPAEERKAPNPSATGEASARMMAQPPQKQPEKPARQDPVADQRCQCEMM